MSMSDPPLTGFSFEPLADLKCKNAAGLRRARVRARTAVARDELRKASRDA